MSSVYDPNANQQNQQDPNKQLQTVSTGAGAATSTPGAAGSKPSGTAQPAQPGNAPTSSQLQGSGRFTNLSKYLNANQEGGQRVAGAIGSNIEGNLNNQQNQSNSYYTQLGNAISNANQQAQTGSDYQKQLQGIGQNIQQNTLTAPSPATNTTPTVGSTSTPTPGLSAADQATFNARQAGQQNFDPLSNFATGQGQSLNNYQQFLQGNAINTNALNNQQQQYGNSVNAYNQAAQQAQQNLGSEQGRYQLLQNIVGKSAPNYSSSMQGLDQALLARSGGLQGIQSNVQQQLNQAQQAQSNVANQAQQTQAAIEQAKSLQSGLGQQSTANQQAYLKMLQSYIDPTNQQRTQQFNDLTGALNSYGSGGASTAANPSHAGLTAQQMADLGVTADQGVYNTLNPNAGGHSADFFVSKGAQAQNTQDVANAQDVARYKALTQMMNPNSTEAMNPTLSQASTLGQYFNNAANGNDLASQLKTADTNFNKAAQDTNFAHNIYNPGVALNHDLDYSSIGNAKDIMNNGLSSVQGHTVGGGTTNTFNLPSSVDSSTYYINPIAQQFQNFMQQQNYDQTLGGNRTNIGEQEANKALQPAINGIKGGPQVIPSNPGVLS